METKRCSKCGEVKALDCFRVRKDRPCGYYAQCKVCLKVVRDAYLSCNVGLAAKWKKDWAVRNPTRIKALSAKFYATHRCYIKERCSTYQKRGVELLSDRYIAQRLCVKARALNCIPPNIIKVTRARLQMVRTMKQLKGAINEKRK